MLSIFIITLTNFETKLNKNNQKHIAEKTFEIK